MTDNNNIDWPDETPCPGCGWPMYCCLCPDGEQAPCGFDACISCKPEGCDDPEVNDNCELKCDFYRTVEENKEMLEKYGPYEGFNLCF